MTLEEAINQAERVAHEQEKNAEIVRDRHGEFVPGYQKHCKRAAEQRQLVNWLREVRRITYCKDCSHCDNAKRCMYTGYQVDDYDFCSMGEVQ